jgi:hypothetical protein
MTVLRKLLSPKRDSLTGGWRRLHKEELYGLNSVPNIIRAIKSRKMRLAGHVSRMGYREDAYRVLILILIHLLTAIGLTPGGSSTVHIYT